MHATRPTRRRLLALLGLLPLLFAVGCGDEEEGAERSRGLGAYRLKDASKRYFGHASLIDRPAVVSSDRVYAQISEYQQIKRKGLTDKDTKYYFLMQKASARFAKAVKAAARAGRYDFVAEIGSIVVEEPGATEPPDITASVIEHIE